MWLLWVKSDRPWKASASGTSNPVIAAPTPYLPHHQASRPGKNSDQCCTLWPITSKQGFLLPHGHLAYSAESIVRQCKNSHSPEVNSKLSPQQTSPPVKLLQRHNAPNTPSQDSATTVNPTGPIHPNLVLPSSPGCRICTFPPFPTFRWFDNNARKEGTHKRKRRKKEQKKKRRNATYHHNPLPTPCYVTRVPHTKPGSLRFYFSSPVFRFCFSIATWAILHSTPNWRPVHGFSFRPPPLLV